MGKGVVDSDDLPLNVNRETLQESKIIKIIKKKLVRKAIELISKMAKETMPEDDDEAAEAEIDADGNVVPSSDEEKPKQIHPYLTWYKKFGLSMKMGCIDDSANRDKLQKLLRFKSSKSEGEDDYVSLKEYVDSAWILLDMATMGGGFPIRDTKKYAARMTRVLKNSLGVESLALADQI